ncbi:MAG: AAA family ATPase [Thermoprotei archaeon]|nr:AAA family ATPase [Thermoprotei archaeon]
MLIIAVTGMPGSGKSSVARVLGEELGAPVLVMGDVVREEAARRGLELTPANLEIVARELRLEYGPGFVADVIAERIKAMGVSIAVVDGVRSLSEIQSFSKLGRVCVVAVHSSPSVRLERVIARGRVGDARSVEEFKLRDRSNIALGIGEAIALADYVIVNNSSLENLLEEARRLAGEVKVANKDCGRGRD